MSEPMVIEFVGRVVEGNDGLEAYFDIEGGIAALEAGCSLYASADLENAGLTDEDGSCEMVPMAEVTQLREALAHIEKTCGQSRTVTRRLRWIAKRAELALAGRPYVAAEHELPVKVEAEHFKLLRQKAALKARNDQLEKLLVRCHRSDNLSQNCGLWKDLDAVINSAETIYVDEGKSGGDMTAKATFRNEGGKLTLESIEHSKPVPFPGYPPVPEDRKRGTWPAPTIVLTADEARKFCPFCFQRGCNGECHGDDMMGDS